MRISPSPCKWCRSTSAAPEVRNRDTTRSHRATEARIRAGDQCMKSKGKLERIPRTSSTLRGIGIRYSLTSILVLAACLPAGQGFACVRKAMCERLRACRECLRCVLGNYAGAPYSSAAVVDSGMMCMGACALWALVTSIEAWGWEGPRYQGSDSGCCQKKNLVPRYNAGPVPRLIQLAIQLAPR